MSCSDGRRSRSPRDKLSQRRSSTPTKEHAGRTPAYQQKIDSRKSIVRNNEDVSLFRLNKDNKNQHSNELHRAVQNTIVIDLDKDDNLPVGKEEEQNMKNDAQQRALDSYLRMLAREGKAPPSNWEELNKRAMDHHQKKKDHMALHRREMASGDVHEIRRDVRSIPHYALEGLTGPQRSSPLNQMINRVISEAQKLNKPLITAQKGIEHVEQQALTCPKTADEVPAIGTLPPNGPTFMQPPCLTEQQHIELSKMFYKFTGENRKAEPPMPKEAVAILEDMIPCVEETYGILDTYAATCRQAGEKFIRVADQCEKLRNTMRGRIAKWKSSCFLNGRLAALNERIAERFPQSGGALQECTTT